MGVLVHKYGVLGYCGDVNKMGATGADFTVECIQRALEHLQVANDSPWKDKPLPPVLKLQLDNCTDNKCAIVFAFCAYLVETGVFLYVEIHFLPCGHTHIRIDQIFSVINKSCKKEGDEVDPPLTFPLFKQRVKMAFSGVYADRIKDVILLKGIHDWTSLFKSCIDPNFAGYGHTQLSGLQILYFEFQKNDDGKAAMSYKFRFS